MGMYANYRRIAPADLQKLQVDSQVADAYFGYDFEEDDEEGVDAWYAAMRSSGRHLDAGKSWHGIQFLLTGNASYDADDIPLPLRNIALGGELTEWEASYGVVRILTPQEVREVSEALLPITRNTLLPRLDAAAFNKNNIYPGSNEWEREYMDWLLNSYEQVANFFHVAASNGDAMLLSLD